MERIASKIGKQTTSIEYVLITREHLDRSSKSVPTPARIIPYPTGRLVWGTLSQALRARLRSCSPSGTLASSSHTTICARHRPNLISDRILHQWDGDSSGMRSRSSCRVTVLNPRRSFDLREISQQTLANPAGCKRRGILDTEERLHIPVRQT
jgi:hypothetical protein